MLYYIGKIFCTLYYLIFGGLKSVGEENIPATGGVILAPNHISYADPPAVGCAMKRKVHYMAKEELFRPALFGRILLAVGAFPVRRGTADRKAIRHALDLLKEGKVICIFPEGARSLNGKLQEAEPGIGLIALKSGAPIVPVAVVGTDKILPADGSKPHRHKVIIEYGKPLTFEDLLQSKDTAQAIAEVGKRVMAAIDALLEKYKTSGER